MVKHDFTLHSGQDFNFTYQVPEGSDRVLTGFTGDGQTRFHATLRTRF
nr:MAG TPA: hypothetical protein [Caudoviricetes sp.]